MLCLKTGSVEVFKAYIKHNLVSFHLLDRLTENRLWEGCTYVRSNILNPLDLVQFELMKFIGAPPSPLTTESLPVMNH